MTPYMGALTSGMRPTVESDGVIAKLLNSPWLIGYDALNS